MKRNSDKVKSAKKSPVLAEKLSNLPLKITGTRLEALTEQLYRELQEAGITFRPQFYLSDSWGCPDSVPVIAIPFYLCNPELCEIVSEFTGTPAEQEDEIIKILRHETGHAFNYAHRLYREPEWERVFGRWDAPYREHYGTRPFSTHFVRDIPGWYGQKHPDEDFAETFAVWLTPDSNWRQAYDGAPALAKLIYIDDVVRRIGKAQPIVTGGELDRPVEEIGVTLEEWCLRFHDSTGAIGLPELIDLDLARLFPVHEGESAAGILEPYREQIIRNIHDWTGLDLYLATALVSELIERTRKLQLRASKEEKEHAVSSFAVFATTLAMNHQLTGEFLDR
jgi:hypothetical protein